MRPLVFLLALFLSGPALAAELDYTELAFPEDARELVASPERYGDRLEYADDKVEAAVKRLYAAGFTAAILEHCTEQGIWSGLLNLPTTAGVYLNERRADKDLEEALPRRRPVREALKVGARALGKADAEALIGQGLCARIER